jgi:hypothetical protein
MTILDPINHMSTEINETVAKHNQDVTQASVEVEDSPLLPSYLARTAEQNKLNERILQFGKEVAAACKKYGFRSFKDYEQHLALGASTTAMSPLTVPATGQIAPAAASGKRPFVTEADYLKIKRMAEANTPPETIAKELNFNLLLIKRWVKRINHPTIKFEYVKPGKKAKPDDTKGSVTGASGA